MIRLPLDNPVYTSLYGERVLNGQRQFHDGIDLISRENNKVYSICPGIVIADKDNYSEALRWTDIKHSVGNFVIMSHEINGRLFFGCYYHLGENYVSVGDKIEGNVNIGWYGDFGISYGAHLHFMFFNDRWKTNSEGKSIINPMDVFEGRI